MFLERFKKSVFEKYGITLVSMTFDECTKELAEKLAKQKEEEAGE